MSAETYQATISRAVQLAGGVQALSNKLRIPVNDLVRWSKGEAKPSPGTFLRIVDYLLQETSPSGAPASERAARQPGAKPRR